MVKSPEGEKLLFAVMLRVESVTKSVGGSKTSSNKGSDRVLIVDGNPATGAQVKRNLCYLIC